MADLLNDPHHWRMRAEEARTRAESFTQASARQSMLQIAEGYDNLARNAETRLRIAAGLDSTAMSRGEGLSAPETTSRSGTRRRA